MFRYFISKLLYMVLTLWGVATVIFLLFTVLPGDPARMMLDQNENSEQLFAIKKKYGFDKPIFLQYLYYLNDLSPVSVHSVFPKEFTYDTGNKEALYTFYSNSKVRWVLKMPYLRTSFQKNGESVKAIIGQTLPNTIVLAISAMALAVFLGVLLGIISAYHHGSFFDRFVQITSTFGMSTPSFFAALIFAWMFGFLFTNITGLSMTGNLYEVDDLGRGEYLELKNLILPSVVLGIRPLAVISQLMRNALLSELKKPYILTAYAKGLSRKGVILNHALKNGVNPVLTAISGWFASLLAGAVFVEYIFAWNGIGKELVIALDTLDLPVIMGIILVISLSFLCVNLCMDIIYKYLDPKIKGL